MNPASLACDCPAKLNLHLSVTGRRADGFHELVSLVSPIGLADRLELQWDPAGTGPDTLACSDPSLPTDGSNLVLKAAARMRAEPGFPEAGQARFALRKRVPHGAGLGGGSSDAVGALRLLNALRPQPLGLDGLTRLAAELGSDCPLFLHPGPVVLRGRGEFIEPLEGGAATALQGRAVLVFKPGFPIPTPWAYGQLVARQAYDAAAEAEARIAAWRAGRVPLEALLHNTFERGVGDKYPTLPLLLATLNALPGVQARLSGSGSACFALTRDAAAAQAAEGCIREAWGAGVFLVSTQLGAVAALAPR